MENISRHIEDGMEPFAATLRGAKEIGFTVMTISISLIAVFIPLILMGGIVGRLFREFAITLSTAILVSMVISLTTTPMMCAHLLKSEHSQKHGRAVHAVGEVLRLGTERLPQEPALDAGQSGAGADRAGADDRAECGHCVQDSEGVLSRSRTRARSAARCAGRRTPLTRR